MLCPKVSGSKFGEEEETAVVGKKRKGGIQPPDPNPA
jgi:hypothetical protein